MSVCTLARFFVFCFKQKTAYELRISDWSSDVCSSDLFELALSGGDLDLRHYTPFRADLKAAKSQLKGSGSFDSTGGTGVSPSFVPGTVTGTASARKSVVSGKSVAVRVDPGGRRISNNTKHGNTRPS